MKINITVDNSNELLTLYSASELVQAIRQLPVETENVVILETENEVPINGLISLAAYHYSTRSETTKVSFFKRKTTSTGITKSYYRVQVEMMGKNGKTRDYYLTESIDEVCNILTTFYDYQITPNITNWIEY
ncbi:MAG: hypothetical protein ACK5LC_03720 [Coprobacillaceae bacterium]